MSVKVETDVGRVVDGGTVVEAHVKLLPEALWVLFEVGGTASMLGKERAAAIHGNSERILMIVAMNVDIPVGGRCTLAAEGSLASEVFGNDRSAEEE